MKMAKSSAEVFGGIYARKVWGDGSGGGSLPQAAGPYMRLVECLLTRFQARTVLDIGCGDGQVAAGINWGDATYIGVEVVPETAAVCLARLSRGTVIVADALEDALPATDLVLCKEVMQHLDNQSVQRLIQRLDRYPAVLHCTAVTAEMNQPIEMGQTRGADLSLPPFDLIVENVLRYHFGQQVYLCQLWRPWMRRYAGVAV